MKEKKSVKKSNVIAEIKTAISKNPVLAYLVGLGQLKAKPTLRSVKLILNNISKTDKYDPEVIRQDCHNILNRIGQLSGTLLKGNVGSVRGFRSGTVMSSQRGTKLGEIIATAMHFLTEQAIVDIKGGKEPTYLKVADGDNLKYQWEAMCSVLKHLGLEKFDRKYDAVHELFTAQLEANNCLEPVEKTPTETVNTLEFEGAAKEVATV